MNFDTKILLISFVVSIILGILVIPILNEEEIPRMNVVRYFFRMIQNNVWYMEKVNGKING